MKKKRKRLFLQIFVIMLVISSVFIMTSYTKLGITGFSIYSVQPDSEIGKDTYIREEAQVNFGDDTAIKLGKTAAGKEYRALFEFDHSLVPSENTVTSAFLELYLYFANSNNNLTLNIYSINSPWNETVADWYNSTDSSNWTAAGGDYDLNLISTIIITNETNKWYNITITSIVKDWVDGTTQNYGLIIMPAGASNGDFVEFYSSDYLVDQTKSPVFFVDYTENAAPLLDQITQNSQSINPKLVSENITFVASWTDVDSSSAQLFVCNSTLITPQLGCLSKTFCSTSLSSSNPLSCQYTSLYSDNRTNYFSAFICDGNNCSNANESYFYVNHAPNITLIQPNGGELVNQSQGNYNIKFNVSDNDSDPLYASIYYDESQNSLGHLLVSNISLVNYCTDLDSKTSTTNNCTYSWNSTGIRGDYYLTIILNDTFHLSNDSSLSTFTVESLFDIIKPVFDAVWISTQSLYSGKSFAFNANITEENPYITLVYINTTPIQNLTLTNNSLGVYSANWTAEEIGNYSWFVYAKDRNNNINQSANNTFSVVRPSALASSIYSPNNSLPYHVIRVSSTLNSSDAPLNVYAYLSVPEGFIFLSDYPQNLFIGNFTENQSKTADWFLSTPLVEGDYNLNVTFTDAYQNSYNSSNNQISISSQGTSYNLDISGYPEVETTKQYLVQSSFTQGGVLVNPDSMTLTLYDSLGNLIVGPVSMTQSSQGRYNYTYTLGASVNEGQWETRINATKNGESYYVNQFWKVIGGPFDVRNISVEDETINDLIISVTTENTGGAIKDLTLVWNLTREDNGEVLDSGADTFAVNPASERLWTIYPSTNYVGQVRITMVGFYSGTEKAGAYKIFSTVSSNESSPVVTPGSSGGGGGGGGGGKAITNQTNQTFNSELPQAYFIYDSNIVVARNTPKTVTAILENKYSYDLTAVNINIIGLDESYYQITPKTIDKIKGNTGQKINITFTITDLLKEKEFYYNISSNEFSGLYPAKVSVLTIEDYLYSEIQRLRNEINDIKNLSYYNEEDSSNLDKCSDIINQAEDNIKEEKYIDSKDKIESADDCIIDFKNNMNTMSSKLDKKTIIYIIVGILAIIIIIAIMIILYKIYKKLRVISFLKKVDDTKEISKDRSEGKRDFESKIKKIEDELNK